jgi:hypothetical protein
MERLREENTRLRGEVAFLQPQAATSAGHSARQPDADETETSDEEAEEEEVRRFECDSCGRLLGSLRMYMYWGSIYGRQTIIVTFVPSREIIQDKVGAHPAHKSGTRRGTSVTFMHRV